MSHDYCRGGTPWPPLVELLLRFSLLLDLAAVAFCAVLLRVVLSVVLHLARVFTTLRVIRLFLAVFGFHFARITHAAASRVFCAGTRRAVFHRTRPAVATTRFHCTTGFCLLLVTLSGGLCYPCCKCDQQQAEKHYQDSSLSGFHFSSPVSKDCLPLTSAHTGGVSFITNKRVQQTGL